MNVLIVPDKFKGTLTALAAAQAIARGWASIRPQDCLELMPMSDGGDGFGEIMSNLLGGELQTVQTIDAAHRPLQSSWWWCASSRTAIIESARIIGLALLPRCKYHPFELDTFGLGAVLQAVSKKGAQRCLVGIGGSATNDAGFGMARALGWKFFDAHQHPIERWTDLHKLAKVCPPSNEGAWIFLSASPVTVAVDVQNTLLGPTGCTRIYGPQKGLRPEDFPHAESCLARLAHVVKEQLNLDALNEPGTGAAGGLGYGLRVFANASLERGFALFSQYSNLPARIKSAQLVLTGEGAIDESTLMGKGVGEIALLSREHHVPCIGLAGIAPGGIGQSSAFTEIHSIAPGLATSERAMAEATVWLERLAAKVARQFRSESNAR